MKRIADYQIVEQLQTGNHGTFFVARAPSRLELDDDLVAIKVLERHATDNEFKRMAAELDVLLRLDHPYLVDVLDAGHEEGRLFYATRYFRDGSLDLGPSEDVADIACIMADAAEAAHALHEIGVAHRDIKPSNILLEEGRGHLCDLGVANYLQAQFTATGSSPVGTLAYADPALIRGAAPGRSSDVWSLGATLHAAVTGRSVLGDIPDHHLAAAIEYVFGAEPELAPDCPPVIGAIVARSIQADPADRYPTAAELAGALRRVADRPWSPVRIEPIENDGTTNQAFPVAERPPVGAATAAFRQPVFVVGARSSAGHFNHPEAVVCRVSGERRDPARPWPTERGVRPPLGVLLGDDGSNHLVHWNLVIGREPESDPRVVDGWAAPVTFATVPTMSRAHLVIEVDDWAATATDVSTNGTRLLRVDGEELMLGPNDSAVLNDGDLLLLGTRSLTYVRYS